MLMSWKRSKMENKQVVSVVFLFNLNVIKLGESKGNQRKLSHIMLSLCLPFILLSRQCILHKGLNFFTPFSPCVLSNLLLCTFFFVKRGFSIDYVSSTP